MIKIELKSYCTKAIHRDRKVEHYMHKDTKRASRAFTSAVVNDKAVHKDTLSLTFCSSGV